MPTKTRLVLWRHPKMGVCADLPDGMRRTSLTERDLLVLVKEWMKEGGA